MTRLDLRKGSGHYKNAHIAGREIIELTHHMSFSAGNVAKYLVRAGTKEGEPEAKDLDKALHYLSFLRDEHESAWVHGVAPSWFKEWKLDALREGGHDLLLSTIDLMHFGLYRQAHLELNDHIKEIPS